jgi:hypothetical protein
MTPQMIADAETFFTTQMNAAYPTMLLRYSNDDPPDTRDLYAVIHVLPSEDVIPINLGVESKSRNVGIIQIDVLGHVDTGAGPTHDVAFYIARQFKRRIASVGVEGQVTYKDPSIQDRGQIGGKHKYMVSIPYRYDFTY